MPATLNIELADTGSGLSICRLGRVAQQALGEAG